MSDYPGLGALRQLKGPANDVQLVRDLLREEFGIPEANLLVLREDPDQSRLPTRANIFRELDALAARTREGDRAIVYLSGHGSLQARRRPEKGLPVLEGIFLPRDVRKTEWGPSVEGVTNAIVDRELSRWAVKLLEKRVSLWLVVDACHSGGMGREKGRSEEREVFRGVPPEELGVPTELIAAAGALPGPEATRGAGEPGPVFRVSTDYPGFAALYACGAREETPELPLPDGRDPVHGLFTFTLGKVLAAASGPLTSAEVLAAIQEEYYGLGKRRPIPLVEGKSADQLVLGRSSRPSHLRLTTRPGLRVNAGLLQGFHPGTVLVVFPPPGRPDADRPLGHLEVIDAQLLVSEVKPCRHGEAVAPARADLTEGCVLRPVFIDFGLEALGVHLDEEARSLLGEDAWSKLAPETSALWRLVAEPARAAFSLTAQEVHGRRRLVLKDLAGGEPCQVESEGVVLSALDDALLRVARARSLLAIAGSTRSSTARWGRTLKVDLRMDIFESKDAPIADCLRPGMALAPGDWVEFEIDNRELEPVDVTLLFVDGRSGIRCLLPPPGVSSEGRIAARRPWRSDRLPVNSETLGLEHVVLIAVSGEGPLHDFSFLRQPTLAALRSGTEGPAFESPLGKLLRYGFYRQGTTRGLPADAGGPCAIRMLHWRTVVRKS